MIPLRDDVPTQRAPVVTIGLIVVCTLVFLWQLSLGHRGGIEAIYALGVIPAVLLKHANLPPEVALVPPSVTIFTSMFLHGGWLHLIGNMLYLWIFGNNVEDSMARGRFIVFYLVCGVVAVFAQVLANPGAAVPMIGASGAISGVLGAYLLLFPYARVVVVIPIFFFPYVARLPATWVLLFWFVLQFVSTLATAGQDAGVAFAAHLGGFVAGMALIAVFKRRGVKLFRPRL